MLSAPSISFTIPSLHDATPLDCRIYLPPGLDSLECIGRATWSGKIAIISHPYAPLGGSFDDPIVRLVVDIIFEKGFMIGTFNFRGAGGSRGHTSWTGNPELDDYISFAGFMIHFARSLDRYSTGSPLLLMGGYSYGALITTLLPDLSTIIQRFDCKKPEKLALDIMAIASVIAEKEDNRLEANLARNVCSSRSTDRPIDQATNSINPATLDNRLSLDIISSRRRSLSAIRYGCDDSNRRSSLQHCRRVSHDHVDVLRKSINRLRSISRSGTLQRPSESDDIIPSRDSIPVQDSCSDQDRSLDGMHRSHRSNPWSLGKLAFIHVQPAYLIISPLQGMVKQVVTFWSAFHTSAPLSNCPTLAIWGDKDTFTSSKKLQAWCERLRHDGAGMFKSVKVRNAGHFWRDAEAINQLSRAVSEFAQALNCFESSEDIA